MSGSYKDINYTLRPAKSIERKMLCESFRRLHEFSSLSSYKYIGFGSTYFSDFSLFHKEIGIKRMISIEDKIHDKPRFEFNKPFNCIDLKFGHSSEILSKLSWNSKSIVWLDYDGEMNSEIIADIDTVVLNLVDGSIFLVTVNSKPFPFDKDNSRRNRLIVKIGEQSVPEDLEETDFGGWGTAKIYRRIINNRIKERLKGINSALIEEDRIKYKQLYNFHYKDGVEMLTVGGIFYRRGQEHIVAKCNFESLDFIKNNEESYLIEVPNLTFKEIRHIDTQLPIDDISKIKTQSIPISDIKNYEKNYRYFPTYSEVEI